MCKVYDHNLGDKMALNIHFHLLNVIAVSFNEY